jgi:IMP dehydrogenase
MEKINSEGLTFDDVLLLPGYADFYRSDIELKTKLTKKIDIGLPFVSSPMDTVTESDMAVALAKEGGIGIIHRNLTVENQAVEVKKVKEKKMLVGAAIGTGEGYKQRVEALVEAGVDILLIDSAHGYTNLMIEAIHFIKTNYSNVEVIAGSVATYDGTKGLIKAGADAIRVGMGPGAICTTRIISGMGVPQITAILESAKAAEGTGVPIIADGGIKFSGDVVKALAAGASTVMMGSYFASALESPGQVVELSSDQVPLRFKSIFKETNQKYKFKAYRGMGSIGAMNKGADIKSEDEFHGKSYKDRVLVAEGVEGFVPVKGSVKDILDQTVGGVRSGLFYVGAKNIYELQQKANFIKITQASLVESHPHDILVTNAGENYG